MHLTLINHGLPQPSSNGGPMTCWAVLHEALARRHRVSVIALRYPGDPFMTPERRDALTRFGVELKLVGVSPSRERQTGLAAIWPTMRLREPMRETLAALRPDALFVYHWDSLAAVHGVPSAPKMAGVGDPWHLPRLRRWQHNPPSSPLRYAWETAGVARDALTTPRAMVELLNGCENAGCFQAQEAAWLRGRGAAQCDYLPTPLVDAGGADWQQRRAQAARPEKPTILLGPSNLEATSTSAGLRLFAREILPRLERALGPDGFRVSVVGEGNPPRELAALLPRPSVTVYGRIEPADQEFLSADVQLVPTPFVLGIRVRIITGMSFGACLVAHANEAANIPELAHGQNALLSSTGAGLAEALVQALRDAPLRRRLGAAARATYERHFRPAVAAARILERLERMAGTPVPAQELLVAEEAAL